MDREQQALTFIHNHGWLTIYTRLTGTRMPETIDPIQVMIDGLLADARNQATEPRHAHAYAFGRLRELYHTLAIEHEIALATIAELEGTVAALRKDAD